MIAHWMAWCSLVGVLLGLGAAAAERALEGLRRPVRWAWAASLALSLAAPVALWFAPEPAPAPVEAGAAPANQGGGERMLEIPAGLASGAAPALPSLDGPLLAGWGLASAAMLGALLGLGATLRVRRRGWSRETVDGRSVLVSRDTGPAVVGLLRSAIVLPRWALDAPEEVRALMIAHEEEHLRAGDPRLLLAALVVAVAMPWNPAVWWQLRRLRLAVEVDCDRRVLREGSDVKAYGTLLLEIGRRASTGVLAVAAFSEPVSFLERRIRTMTRPRVRAPLLRAAALGGVAALALAAACEAPRPGRINPVASETFGGDDEDARSSTSPADREALRRMVAEHFPAVLQRGMEGNDHLIFVTDADGRVLQATAGKRPPFAIPAAALARDSEPTPDAGPLRVTVQEVNVRAPAGAVRERIPGGGLDAVDPEDIQRVQVSKQEAGRMGPDPVDLIVIALKPGVTLAETSRHAEERARSPRGEEKVRVSLGPQDGEYRATPRGVIEAAVRQAFPDLREGSVPSEPLVFVADARHQVLRSGVGTQASEMNRIDPARIEQVEVFKNDSGIRVGQQTANVIWITLKDGTSTL